MSNPIAPGLRISHGWLWLLIALLAGWTAFQAPRLSTVAAGADSSGYLNSARLFASGRLTDTLRLPAEIAAISHESSHFQPLGFWLLPGTDRLAPTYPTGLPLHFALAGQLLGWQVGTAVVVIAASLACLLLVYACARETGVSPALALTGSVILAASPVFIFSSMQPLSDVLATCWCSAAFYCALRARRGSLRWAAGAGVSLAVAVLVRPSNALLLPSLVILIGHWRSLLAAGLAGLPGAIWLGYVNFTLYGHPLRTGYGDIGESLGLQWLWPSLSLYLRWLPTLLPTLLLLLPFAALLRWRMHGRLILALLCWWLAFAGFYAFYNVTHEVWWCLRFLLPAFPALILGALIGAEVLASLRPQRQVRYVRVIAAVLLAWAGLGLNYWRTRIEFVDISRHELAYQSAVSWAQKHLPANSVIATLPASGSLYFYTDFPVLRWDFLSPRQFEDYRQAFHSVGRPLYAMLFPGEDNDALHRRMPGKWDKLDEIHGITFWRNLPP